MAPPTSISLSANGVDARTFAALANLLSLRSGGQLEPSVELEGVVDEDEEADMIDFVERLEKELWIKMLKYSALRTSDLVVNRSKQLSTPAAQIIFKEVRELLILSAAGNLEESSTGSKSMLVQKAWSIRRSQGALSFLEDKTTEVNLGYRIWIDICFLGRLREAYVVFLKATKTLPCFANVKINAIPGPSKKSRKKAKYLRTPLGLDETFRLLGLSLNQEAIQAVVGNKTVQDVSKLFGKLQSLRGDIHAEVQMILFINHKFQLDGASSNYIGCSKKTCFMCRQFLQSYGTFSTRRCHGKLYSRWAIPPTAGLSGHTIKRVNKALRDTQDAMVRELWLPVAIRKHEEESSIGHCGTLCETKSWDNAIAKQYRQSHQEIGVGSSEKWLKVEYAQLTENQEPKTGIPDKWHRPPSVVFRTLDDVPSAEHPEILESQKVAALARECEICERETTRTCSYCDQADYLYLAISEDKIPDDSQTREDYGFAYTRSPSEGSKLLSLFIGLSYMNIDSQKIHKWRQQGLLVD
ncbi:MAG: hypothetical protein MMC33_006974 [Icmadophila ericetorum]|nr:hypothetical protein [Icmadophila ericetorum]